jgi:NRPS condensation-like uncharacterized protein
VTPHNIMRVTRCNPLKKKKYWYKLDNAGKIFPAVSKDDRSNVFRLSFYLNETIDPIILEEAVNKILPRFESLAVQLKNGLFWNYFASNERQLQVEIEPAQICKYFKPDHNHGYLFKVYYLKNKITLETFHAISDGTGALHLLKSIVYQYFKLRGFKINHEGKILSEKPILKRKAKTILLLTMIKIKERI